MIEIHFNRLLLVFQALADHAAGGNLRELLSGGLRNKRNGSGSTRIDFEHEDFRMIGECVLNRELNIHQTDDV